MKQGKIVKGIAGFYYVSVAGSGIYECKAKGAFRQKKMKPLVGDNVSIDIIDEEEKKGNVVEILPRKNALVRPAVANGSGTCDFRRNFAKAESESAGSFFTDDGTTERADADLF